jgi:hypothetical protein
MLYEHIKVLLDAPPKFRRIRWNGIKTLTWTKNLVEKVKLSGMKDRACRQSTQAVNPLQHAYRGLAEENMTSAQ